MEAKISYPWQNLPSEKRGEFVAAIAQRFKLVHFSTHRRATIKDIARKVSLFTPHPEGIGHHSSGRLIYKKNSPWIPVGSHENGLILELMKFDLLFVKEND